MFLSRWNRNEIHIVDFVYKHSHRASPGQGLGILMFFQVVDLGCLRSGRHLRDHPIGWYRTCQLMGWVGELAKSMIQSIGADQLRVTFQAARRTTRWKYAIWNYHSRWQWLNFLSSHGDRPSVVRFEVFIFITQVLYVVTMSPHRRQ